MESIRKAKLMLAFALVILLLTGCTSNDADIITQLETATPLPTTNPEEGLQVTATQACQIYRGAGIQSRVASGDMIAWSPKSDMLAYIAPVNRTWAWGVGDLAFYTLSTKQENFTTGIPFSGDLTWSPDGSKLAAVTYDSNANFHSVYVVSPNGLSTQNLFPGGEPTDTFDSMKGILNWVDNASVVINESCGIDCLKTLEIDTLTMQQALRADARKSTDTSLSILQPTLAVEMVRNWSQPLESPDTTKVVYIDTRGQAWLINVGEKTKYSLYNGVDEIIEMKWAPDSKSLALRTSQNVLIYQFECN